MKAESLRIGNWVEYFGKNKQIDGIKSMSTKEGYAVEIISTDVHGNSIREYTPLDSQSLKPIPLTEEWVLRFGFEIKEDPESVFYSIYFDGLTNGSVEIGRTKGCSFYYFENINFITQIKHVHEMQNIFHALTGEELKLKK
jgi:hypothetical protein